MSYTDKCQEYTFSFFKSNKDQATKTTVHTARFSSHSTGARRYPLSYVYSGYYLWGGGNLSSQDSYGRWWSTAAYSDNNAYYLTMNSSDLVPQNNGNKARGFTLRCISYYSTGARRYPLSYVYSGSYVSWETSEGIGGQVYEQGSYGDWWTTLAEDDTYANRFIIALNYAMLSNNARKIAFYPLRSNRTRRYPLSYVYSGNYAGTTGSIQYQGTDGYNWSTTAKDNGISYAFYFRDNALVTIDREYPKTVYFALRSTIARRYPLSYVFSGRYYWGDGNLYGQDSLGVWWSTTALSDSLAYHLYMHSSDLHPRGNANKAYGFALRSILRF